MCFQISILVTFVFVFSFARIDPQTSCRHVLYNAELEYEPTKPHRMKWSFKTDAQRDEYIKEITDTILVYSW